MNAVCERALLWARTGGIEKIRGLNEGESATLSLQSGNDTIELVPVTYNDWLTLDPNNV